MEREIKITNQPEIDDLSKATMYLLLSMPFIYIIPTAAILLAILNSFMNSSGLIKDSSAATWELLIVFPIMILLYFIMKSALRKGVSKNPKSLETQHFIFDSRGFSVTGETYSTQYLWTTIHKIKETNSWFLIYTHKMAAQPIRKENLSDAQCHELKELFRTLPIKKKLKA